MTHILEARYIQVLWQDKSTARKVVVAQDPLELEEIDARTLQADIVSYSKIDDGSQGQFALRLRPDTQEVPHFLLANGTSVSMMPVIDPVTGHCWWVEGQRWDAQHQRWQSEIYRSAGQVKICIANQVCLVNISTSTFNHQQLENYLKDFRNDFWELILDDSSHVSGAARNTQYQQVGETTLQAIREFIASIEKMLKKPKVELREIQQKKPSREARPVPRTFMEIATRGSARMLTSRAFHESLDVPENRYAHYALRKVYQITKALVTVAASQQQSLERSLASHYQRLGGFTAFKIFNKEAVLFDLREKENRLEEIKETVPPMREALAHKFSHIPATRRQDLSDIPSGIYRIELTAQANSLPGNPYFASLWQWHENSWFKFNVDGYLTLDIGPLQGCVAAGRVYEIHGKITSPLLLGNERHHSRLLGVSAISLKTLTAYTLLSQRLRADREQIRTLETNKWQRPLTWEEAEQQKREKRSVERTIELMQARLENIDTVIRELSPRLPAMRAVLETFKTAKVGLSGHLPNSMTYVRNPAYQGIHRSFLVIKQQAGIEDDEILMALDRIEEIGLVNISMIYERWCLLQLIKVLMFRFSYRPQIDWKQRLIAQILTQGRNISISFSHDTLHRDIVLHYEMELANGRRPDFVLDITAGYGDTRAPKIRRFVLDAKFYQDINHPRHGGLENILHLLSHEKDYAEGGKNAVFVIHPSLRSLPVRGTPQVWARDQYYGEVPLFARENRHPDHRYGGIALSPVGDPTYLDALQRTLGLFLQYSIEDNKIEKKTHGALPEHKAFCLACGSADVHCENSSRNQKAWWITCNECHHFTTYNHCFACSNRLIKNGEYWTYHAMEPLQPLNIKCPDCGNMF